MNNFLNKCTSWLTNGKANPQTKGWLASVFIHLLIFMILALTGILAYTPLKDTTSIIEVSAVGGGSFGGGGAPSAPVEENITPEQIGADAILEHSDTAKVKISYDELKTLKPQEDKPETKQNRQPNNNTKQNQNNNNNKNTNNNDGPGNGQNKGPNEGDGPGNKPGPSTGNQNGPGSDINPNTIYSINKVDTPPQVLHAVTPRYPQELIDDEITGTTVVSMILSASGAVESASIAQSSGNRQLDREALKAAQGFRFSPAKIKNIPVRCQVRRPFKFHIN